MIIETKVPEDVRKYKTKLFGPFTSRQVLCASISAGCDVPVAFAMVKLGVNPTYLIYAIILIDVPIMLFAFDMKGMPMRQYLVNILLPNLFAPAKRKTVTILQEHDESLPDKRQAKNRKKREEKAAKNDKGYRAYL